jgi:hypothetical protein
MHFSRLMMTKSVATLGMTMTTTTTTTTTTAMTAMTSEVGIAKMNECHKGEVSCWWPYLYL